MLINVELTPVETLIILQSLGFMILDSEIHPDDRIIAYEIKQKINKSVNEQLSKSEISNRK